MGKKGVILDSGKTAQSSMALYWKVNRDRAKHPKEKPQEENDKEITDKSVMSNFEKWKLHKEKLITKAYKKPSENNEKSERQSKQEKEDEEEEEMKDLLETKKPKIMTIPGFKSKEELAKRLEIEKPKEADQSTNILKLPSHMQGMTQEDVLSILRQKKSNVMMNKLKEQRNQSKAEHQNDEENMLLDDEYIDLTKNKDKKIIENFLEEKIEEEVKEPEPTFFKSDILNQIEKKGVGNVLCEVSKKPEGGEKIVDGQQSKEESELKTETKKNEIPVTEEIREKQVIIDKKFIPRALKK